MKESLSSLVVLPSEGGGREAGMNEMQNEIKRFFVEEDGVGVVEIILILVVIVGLIVVFKSQLSSIVNKAFKGITNKANGL